MPDVKYIAAASGGVAFVAIHLGFWGLFKDAIAVMVVAALVALVLERRRAL